MDRDLRTDRDELLKRVAHLEVENEQFRLTIIRLAKLCVRSKLCVRCEPAHETPETIGRWIEETFPGGDPTSPRKALRLMEEVAELCKACGANYCEVVEAAETAFGGMGPHARRPEPGNIPAESADAYIVLCGLAKLMDFGLEDAVDAKMVINRHEREWIANGDGTGYHKK